MAILLGEMQEVVARFRVEQSVKYVFFTTFAPY